MPYAVSESIACPLGKRTRRTTCRKVQCFYSSSRLPKLPSTRSFPLPFRTRSPPAAVAKLVAFVVEEEVSASRAGRGVRSGRTRDRGPVLVLGKGHPGRKRQR